MCGPIISFHYISLYKCISRASLRALTRVVATVQCEPPNKPQQAVVALALLLLFTIKLLHLLYFHIFFQYNVAMYSNAITGNRTCTKNPSHVITQSGACDKAHKLRS